MNIKFKPRNKNLLRNSLQTDDEKKFKWILCEFLYKAFHIHYFLRKLIPRVATYKTIRLSYSYILHRYKLLYSELQSKFYYLLTESSLFYSIISGTL